MKKSQRHRGSRDTQGTHGTHGHTDHTDELHNHPSQPSRPTNAHTHNRATSPQPTEPAEPGRYTVCTEGGSVNEWMKAINVCIHNQYVLVCWRWAPSLDGFTLLIKRRGPHVNWTGKHPLYRYRPDFSSKNRSQNPPSCAARAWRKVSANSLQSFFRRVFVAASPRLDGVTE